MEISIKFKISKAPQISLGNHLTSSYFEKTSLFMLLFCVYSGKNVIINYQGLPSDQSNSLSAKNSTEQGITAVEGTILSTSSISPWPMGKYCMFKLHDNRCPTGLTEGKDISDQLYYFYKDKRINSYLFCTYTSCISGAIGMSLLLHHSSKLLDINAINETDYNKTKISFCCSSSGDAEQEVILPRSDPFFLLPSSNNNCQKVINFSFRLVSISFMRTKR